MKPRILIQSFDVLCNTIVQEVPPGNHSEFPLGMVYWPRSVFEILEEGLPDRPPPELGATLKARLHDWHEQVMAPIKSRDKYCPICGKPGFLGFGSDPSIQFCPDHMPGLSDQDRALYRKAAAGGSR